MRKFATLASMLVAVATGLIATGTAYGGPQEPGVDAKTAAPLEASEQRSERTAASAPSDSPPPAPRDLEGQTGAEALATATEESPDLFAPGPTSPFELRAGDRVGQYLSRFSARIEDRNSQPQGLVVSTIPLRVRDEKGDLEPTEFALEETPDGFRSQAPVVPVEYPADVSDPITVGSSVRFRFAGADDATGTIAGQQVFWANAMTDTDLLATPLPLGVETFAQLRSENSPRRLRLSFDLPQGAVLRQAMNSAGRPTGWVEIAREETVLAQIPPAVSTDANDRPVASRYEIDGGNLDVVVDHGPGSAYPLLVDPAILDYQFGSDPSNTNGFISDGFGWFRNAAGVPVSSFSFVPNSDNNAGGGGCPRPNGAPTVSSLCVGAFQGANYGSLSLGDWTWRPPAGAQVLPVNPDGSPNDSYVYRLDMRSAFFQVANTYLYSGLFAPRRNNWIGVSNDSASPTVKPANPYTLTGSNSSFYRTYCIDAGCSDTQTDGTVDGTYARWGIGAGGTNAGGISTMQGAAMYQGDRSPAAIAVAFNQALWYRAGTTITVNGQDKGLGMRAVSLITSLSNGQPANPQSISSCNGTRTNRCPPSYTNAFPVDTTLLSEGPVPVTALAQDILGKSSTQALTVKVDRTPPSLTLGGTLYDARDGYVGPNRDLTLSASAVDGALTPATAQRSGATSIEAVLDPDGPNPTQLVNSPATAPCSRPEGSCTLTLQATLSSAQIAQLDPTVTHSVRVTAKDALGQPSVSNVYFKIDAVEPSIDYDGSLASLADLEPRPLTDGSYQLAAQAVDNRPTQTDVDDAGDPIPTSTLPGVGLLDIVVRVDGQSVTTTSTQCFNPPCESARVWNWNTSSVQNGEHTVTVTAADKVGNERVDSFVVDVENRPDEPSRGPATVRRVMNGGSVGDRAGTAVAALGDVNGDGYSDYAVGAPGAGVADRAASGAVYIVLGAADTSPVDLSAPGASVRRLSGDAANSRCGTSVATAGDVNGDGLADLLVGCPGVDSALGSLSSTGRVFVVFGRTDPQNVDLGALGSAGFVVNGPQDGPSIGVPSVTSRTAVFGERLQSAPNDATKFSQDVNGDGLADIAIGDSAHGSGAAFVVFGKSDSAPVTAASLGTGGFMITGTRANGLTGYSAAIGGDVNGDSLADVLVGSPGAMTGTEGRAYVVPGATTNSNLDLSTPSDRFVTLTSGAADDRFGVNVGAVGDTNLDNRDDFAVSSLAGAWIVRRTPDTSRALTVNDGYRVLGPTNSPPLLSAAVPGVTLGAAGDLDGDERSDIVLGYPDASAGSRAYSVNSPEASRVIDVAALPGQRGGIITTGVQSDHAGASVSANSYIGTTPVTENAQAVVGAPDAAPGLKLGAGQAYVVADRTPNGPGVLPEEPDTSGAAAKGADSGTNAFAAGFPKRINVDVSPTLTRWASVRERPGVLVIGSIKQGGYLTAQQPSRGTSYIGQPTGGSFSKNGKGRYCGWVLRKQLDETATSSGTNRSACRTLLFRETRFAQAVNVDQVDHGSLTPLVNTNNQNIEFWRNVQPFRGSKEKPYDLDCRLAPTQTRAGNPPVPHAVRWRYITSGGRFALVQLANEGPAPSNPLDPDGPKNAFSTKTECGNNAWGYIETKYLSPLFAPAGSPSLCKRPKPVKPLMSKDPDHLYFPQVCAIEYQDLPGTGPNRR